MTPITTEHSLQHRSFVHQARQVAANTAELIHVKSCSPLRPARRKNEGRSITAQDVAHYPRHFNPFNLPRSVPPTRVNPGSAQDCRRKAHGCAYCVYVCVCVVWDALICSSVLASCLAAERFSLAANWKSGGQAVSARLTRPSAELSQKTMDLCEG